MLHIHIYLLSNLRENQSASCFRVRRYILDWQTGAPGMVFVAPQTPQVTRFFEFGAETWRAYALHTHIYAF
jgi:hypothetical protein